MARYFPFPPVPMIPPPLERVQEKWLPAILLALERTGAPWFPCLQWLWGCSLPGIGSDQELPDDRPAFVGLVTECKRLERLGLSVDVVPGCLTPPNGKLSSVGPRCVFPALLAFLPLTISGQEFSLQLKLMLLLFHPVTRISVKDLCSATL